MGAFDDLIDQLIDRRYTGIAVESYKHEEQSGGYQDEQETWSVVAKKSDGSPVRLTAERQRRFGPGTLPASIELSGSVPIDAGEYSRVVTQKGVADDAEYRARLDARRQTEQVQRRGREKAQAALDKIRPSCPNCGKSMAVRAGKHGAFWGCVNFPNCKGTTNMDAAARKFFKDGAS